MIALGLLLVIVGIVVAAVLMGRADRTPPDEPVAGTDIVSPPGVVPLHRSVPLFAEALGYIGGVLVLVALGVIVKEYWSDLGVAGRLALSAGAAGGLFGLGAILTVERDVALVRLRAFLWLASAAATGLLAGVIVVDVVDSHSTRTSVMAVAGAFALQCGVLWRNRFRPLQQLGFVFGFAVFLGALVDQFADHGPMGVGLWLFGAACVMGGLRRLIIDRTISEAAGAVIALAGAMVLTDQWTGFGQILAVTTAWALMAPALVRGVTAERREQILFAVIGAVALVMTVPGSIGYFAFQAGILTGVVVWSAGAGLLVLGARAMVRAALIVELLGAALLLIGAAVCGVQNAALAPLFGLVTAIALIVLGTRPGMAIMSLFGSVGLLINVPWTIAHYFPGRGRMPFLILVSGLLILGVAVLLARTGGRLRDEVGPKRQHMRHAA